MAVSIGIVGLGRIARSHIDAIQYWNDCELGAVIDIDEKRAKAFADEYGAPYYVDTETAYSDAGIDAVVICVPHHLHAPLAIEALEAGQHVLVEKVMATSVADGDAMVSAARENDRILMIGQSRRFFPELRAAYERRDEIGTPINLLYTFACHFDVTVAPPWWQVEEKTGGLVYPMLGAHSIDYTLWMLDDRDPEAVYAAGASHNADFEGDDDATIIIHFGDGSYATNFLTINTKPRNVHRGLVVGTEGSIMFDQAGDHSGDLVGTADTELLLNGQSVTTDPDAPHNFAFEMREFTDAILEDRPPSPSGADVIPQLKVIAAAWRSAESGQVVRLEDV